MYLFGEGGNAGDLKTSTAVDDFLLENSVQPTWADRLEITVKAGAYGLLNNAIGVAKWAGADVTTYNIKDELNQDEEGLGDLYELGKEGYDLAGDVLASFIPGTIMFKGIKAIKAAKTLGTMSKKLRFFDDLAVVEAKNVEIAYKTKGIESAMWNVRAKMYTYKTMQDVVEGTAISAATEMTLNLGDMLNDEGMNGMQITGKILGDSLLWGGMFAPFTAVFSYKDLTRGLKGLEKELHLDHQKVAYQSPIIEGVSGITGDLNAGTKVAYSLSEIERIRPIQMQEPSGKIFKDDQLSLAKNDIAVGMADLTSSLPDELAKDINKYVTQNLEDSKTVTMLGNVLNNTRTFQNAATAFTSLEQSYTSALKKLGIKFVSANDDPLMQGRSFMHVIKPNIGTKGKPIKGTTTQLFVNPDADGYVKYYRQAVRHYAHPEYEYTSNILMAHELDEFKRLGVTNADDSFTRMQSAYESYRIAKINQAQESGFKLQKQTNRFQEQSPLLHAHFDRMGKEAESIYGKETLSYLDLMQGTVLDKPIIHIGDHGSTRVKGKVVVAGNKTYKPKVSYDVKSSDLTEEIQRIQAARIMGKQRASVKNAVKPAELDSYEALFKAENMLDAQNPMADLEQIASAKSKQVNALIEEGLSSKDVANTLGVTENFIEKRGLVDQLAIDDIITDVKPLTQTRGVAILQDTSKIVPETELSLQLKLDSQRAGLKASLGSMASHIIGEDLTKELPKFNSLFVEEKNVNRMWRDASTIGDYGSFDRISSYVNNWINTKSREKFESGILPQLKRDGELILSDPEAQAEFKAFRAWYEKQGSKFVKRGKYWVDTAIEEKFDPSNLGELKHGQDFYRLDNEIVAGYIDNLQKLNREHVLGPKIKIENAYGNTVKINPDFLYLPPTDYKFNKIIRVSATPLDSHSEKLFRVVGRDQKDLDEKVAQAVAHGKSEGQTWTALSEKELETFGEDAQRRQTAWSWQENLMDVGEADSDMARHGQIDDAFVNASAGDTLEHYTQWFRDQNANIHSAAIEMHYAPEMSQLDAMHRTIQAKENLAKKPKGLFSSKNRSDGKVADRYLQGMQQLAGRDNGGHSFWKQLNNVVEDRGAVVINTIREIYAKQGLLSKAENATGFSKESWETSQKYLEERLKEAGIGMPFKTPLEDLYKTNSRLKGEDLRRLVAKANMIQSTLMIRMDSADGLMNILGTVTKMSAENIMLNQMIKQSSTEQQVVFENTMRELFGAGQYVTEEGVKLNFSSTVKAFAKAIERVHTPAGKADIARWKKSGLYLDDAELIQETLADIGKSSVKLRTPSQIKSHEKMLNKVLNSTVKFTTAPHRASNAIAQYAALYFAESIGKSAGLKGAELTNLLFSYSRSVNAMGAHTLKPRLFQGSLGLAIGLYQSYVFHTVGAMYRYAGRGAKKGVAQYTALNTSFFGVQSMPGMQFINNNIIGQNPERDHADLYTAAYTSMNKHVADFVMYGAGSWALQSNLSTRGSLTPRHITMVPTNVQDIPVIGAMSQLLGGTINATANFLTGQSGVPQSTLNMLHDVHINRPLAGLATILLGKSYDTKFSNVQAADDLFSWNSALRLAGMKPLHEQVVNDWRYRQLSYKRHDQEMIQNLGEAMRHQYADDPNILNKPDYITGLMRRYSKAGGSLKHFNQWTQESLLKAEGDLSHRLEKSYLNDLPMLRQYNIISRGVF